MEVPLSLEIFSYKIMSTFGDVDLEDIFSRLPSFHTTHMP